MDSSTTPNGMTRSISGIRDAVAPLWQTLSTSFTARGMQRRIDEDVPSSEGGSGRFEARPTLTVPNTSIFDKNPQVFMILHMI